MVNVEHDKQHWTLIIIGKDKNIYFDPCGEKMPGINNKSLGECESNTYKLLNNDSEKCGLLCLAFFKLYLEGIDYREIFGMFNEEKKHLEKMVDGLFKDYYSSKSSKELACSTNR